MKHLVMAMKVITRDKFKLCKQKYNVIGHLLTLYPSFERAVLSFGNTPRFKEGENTLLIRANHLTIDKTLR